MCNLVQPTSRSTLAKSPLTQNNPTRPTLDWTTMINNRLTVTLAATLLSAAALPVMAQSTSAELYGQIRLTVNSVTTGDRRVTELRDNASRLGSVVTRFAKIRGMNF